MTHITQKLYYRCPDCQCLLKYHGDIDFYECSNCGVKFDAVKTETRRDIFKPIRYWII